MSRIDMLEALFTRTTSGGHPNRVARRLIRQAPDRDLRPEERYSLRLYLWCALRPIIQLTIFYYLLLVVMTAWAAIRLCEQFPELYHAGPALAPAWRGVWTAIVDSHIPSEFRLMPFVPLIWALMGLLAWLPRAYFWNRRARRLECGAISTPHTAEEAAWQDDSVWPPAPRSG